jgi:ribonucleoside-diphosphate reductase alpha chain/ribonucleoside-triphosphate reductase
VNAIDPLVKVMEKLGYSICAETGQDIKTCNTKVIEFPMKSPAKRTRVEVSAIEQLDNYRRFMTHYVEMNASITVTVKEDEWDSVEKWVWNNWDCIVGISFLSIDTTTYPLMPYEKITEEEYEDMMKKIKPFNPELLKQFEQQQEDIEEVEEVGGCDGNICPIR